MGGEEEGLVGHNLERKKSRKKSLKVVSHEYVPTPVLKLFNGKDFKKCPSLLSFLS